MWLQRITQICPFLATGIKLSLKMPTVTSLQGIEKESDFGQPGSKLIRFLISYNGQATINKDFCKLGNIKLKKTFDRCHVDIEIHMPESVQVVHKTAGKIIVSGISNTGEKEQLTITGPQVDQISQKMNCFRITFDNTS
ncbi:uncharacterized protein LOC118439353 [Folsomia candida]|uniref:uncharacterized protein LOC118439353 n=1 Tax=Folsomia candida TaxID=158441 RepID=UPI0016054F73|nr:uncharacterized protein LOC118439353 [Folsomia candida]